MFPKIYTLPGAEHDGASNDRNRKVYGRQGRADVGRHIVITFNGVGVSRVAVRHEPGKKIVQVVPHIRVRIFLDQKRSGSMAQIHCEQAILELLGRGPLFDGCGTP